MELFAIWVALAAIVGYAAHRKGRTFAVFMLFALVFSPLIALVVLVIMGDPKPQVGVADEIGKLAALRDAGTLTVEEYERQKSGLLRMRGK